MSKPVEAVLFDIDGTLCEYKRGTAELLEAAFDHIDREPFITANEYEAHFGDYIDVSNDMADLRERCFAAIASDKGFEPELGRSVARAYQDERDHANVRFLEGMEDVLHRFERSYRLAAITNGAPSMQQAKLDALGLEMFETVVYAGYDTEPKPDPAAFEIALEAIDTEPSDAVYVGNSLEHDVAGANAAGLRSAWLANGRDLPTEPTPDFVLDSPAELLPPPWKEYASR